LILWNTLGSVQEIENSVFGLNGSFNGGGGAHFVSGISGNAVMAMPVGGLGSVPDSAADLVVIKVAAPDPVTVGKHLTYTITATNNGPSTAT
jgi:hypothetical protein